MNKEFFEDVIGTVSIFISGILLLFLLAIVQPVQAQRVIRNGNTFKFETISQKKDTLLTEYRVEHGEYTYPIIVNKKSGRCYIWKRSKAGKMYRKYLPPYISRQVCKELHIKYVEKVV